MKRRILFTAALAAGLATVPLAQMRVAPLDEEQGHVGLGLALRHLSNTGIFMNADAHPDDEDNGLFVMLNRGQGYRTALVTATRGNGGQNEIGPEIFEALGVLRTEELAALHRFDGAEQYFTRAVDFGYSFSLDETFAKWGREEITSDFVRLIRTIRPDVITTMSPLATGGGVHHAASAVISHDAYSLAADPAKYQDQIRGGLRPWQAKKFYYRQGFITNAQPGKWTRCELAVFDPLLGKTYSEIGTEARSMHKCQGMAQLLALPGPATSQYELAESTIPGAKDREEKSLFDGIDTSLAGLARVAGARPPKELVDGLASVASAVQLAQRKFDTETDDAVVPPLVTGLRAVRVLRNVIRNLNIDDQARFEIDFRLRQKEREFQQAALIAAGIRIEALADDGVVVPGQAVKVSVIAANHGSAEVAIKQVRFEGFDSDAPCTLTAVTAANAGGGRGRGAAPLGPPLPSLRKDQVGRCDPSLKIPAKARVTEPYWHRAGDAGRYTFDGDAPFGLPYRPTQFYVQVTMAFPGGPGVPSGEEVFDAMPVVHRYEGNIFSGEKRSELLVVPALSVRVSPDIVIFPSASLKPVAVPPAAPPAARGRGHGQPPSTPAQPARGLTASSAQQAPPPPPPPPPITREIRVTVVNDTPGAIESVVKLDVPEGWTAIPEAQTLKFARQDESLTVRFQFRPGANTANGEFQVRAVASVADQGFDRGYQAIEYPHIRRQHIYDRAASTVKVLDVKTAPNLTVGYIMGVGDQVPPTIEQLGVKVEMIGPDDLAWGNLSRFDAIVTGVRAYERREDLRANNSRLIDYVQNGGTVIVQYNKFEFNEAQYGPYPAQLGSFAGSGLRVTDENAPVKILAPDDPVFHQPNEITEAAWQGWKQERGLYFMGEKDSRYRDLIELADPFPNNPGPKRGALVEATYGKGHWVYVGLNLWRQLPAGTDGAYEIMANLISLGRVTASKSATPPAAPAR
jgi:LmbE family N-acetylglucosaminyl deacetylase